MRCQIKDIKEHSMRLKNEYNSLVSEWSLDLMSSVFEALNSADLFMSTEFSSSFFRLERQEKRGEK